MDKTRIKNFAVWARRYLIENVSKRASYYGIYDEMYLDEDIKEINGKILRGYEIRGRMEFIKALKDREYAELIEEIAYTWFNRLIALYYMEVNSYSDSETVFFVDKTGEYNPNIFDKERAIRVQGSAGDVIERLCKTENKDELYRYLLMCRCNSLGDVLPEMFKKINSYTEIMCPTGLLEENSIVYEMIYSIDRVDWIDNIEIISRLYQFYNTEPKNNAFALLKRNQKLTKERIPEATQLFTPEWIAGYMVENSLGRFWIEHKSDTGLKKHMPYYMDEASGLISKYDADLKPEQIRFIDPCMGSGHILGYAFDLFYIIYQNCGYSKEDTVRNILQYNLYGLDIDERACQLASFSIMMKACRYDKNILRSNIHPQFYSVCDSNFIDDEIIDFVAGDNDEYRRQLNILQSEFSDARELGSIIKLREMSINSLYNHVRLMDADYYEDIFSMMKYNTIKTKLIPFLRQAQILTQTYDIAVTNPPYMALSNMDVLLGEYVKRVYKDSKKDMYAVFIEKCLELVKENGYVALITQHTWMFISSYAKLRKKLYKQCHFLHMLHLGTRAFEEISGEVVQTTTWVMRHKSIQEIEQDSSLPVRFIKLDDTADKEKEYLKLKDSGNNSHVFINNTDNMKKIPGMPMAYFVSSSFSKVYENLPLETYADASNGLFTCDNKRFLKYWYEMDYTKIVFDCSSKEECIHSGAEWFPYNKGGGFRRWYGCQDYIINFKNFGEDIANYREERGQSRQLPGALYYFRPSISWSLVSPGRFSVRYYPKGFVFDIAGSSVFVKQESQIMPMLAILASDTIHTLMKISNPTINYQCGDVRNLPFIPELLDNRELEELASENVLLEKEDYDSFETSWNFKKHPLTAAESLRKSYDKWVDITKGRFCRLMDNETRINEIVGQAYGLKINDISPVAEEDITVYRTDIKKDMESFLSYAVGCMFGRYTPDKPGIIYAGGNFDTTLYNMYQPVSSINPEGNEVNSVYPMLCKLLKLIFPVDMLEDNLRFIGEALGCNSGDYEKEIRRYYKTDFIKNHNKTYKNAPIYYNVEDEKHNKILKYIHRV